MASVVMNSMAMRTTSDVLPARHTNALRAVRARPRPMAMRAKAVVASSNPASNSAQDTLAEVGITTMRVAAGVLMIHNGLDKLADPEGFAKFVVEPFLGELSFCKLQNLVAWFSAWRARCGLTGTETQVEWISPCTFTCIGCRSFVSQVPSHVDFNRRQALQRLTPITLLDNGR